MFTGKRELSVPAALNKEWISTNALGGWASSSIADVHTRRYHGWLMASILPPSQRVLCFSRLMETFHSQSSSIDFSSAEYESCLNLEGVDRLNAFWTDPVPSFLYDIDGSTLLKQIYLLPGRNVCVVLYRLLDNQDTYSLSLRPLLNWRGFHHLTHTAVPGWSAECSGNQITATAPGGGRLRIIVSSGMFREAETWYHNTLYRQERTRGLDFLEEHWSPGIIEAEPRSGRVLVLVGLENDTRNLSPSDIDLPPLAPPHEADTRLTTVLKKTARTFVVRRGSGKSIIAGYHWFSDWGRDTMIALPGILLADGAIEEALEVLETWSDTRHKGLIPNRFRDEDSSPEWNSVDGPLWFVNAVYKYWQYSQHTRRLSTLLDAVEDILENYIRGTLFGIRMDSSGLIYQGQPGLQLTWMDAKVHDQVVTQRLGYCVDVNALWYNALRCASQIEKAIGRNAKSWYYEAIAERVLAAFNDTFWTGTYLKDTTPHGTEIRPNQVLAASLPFTPLCQARIRSVVATCKRTLLIPYGLRTLDPSSDAYHGRYCGNAEQRDRAYHQGTAWPWLLGQFTTALKRSGEPCEMLWSLVLQFEPHLREAGLGTISEVFDADFPHEPGGCISQAWSVAELLRAVHEDILCAAPDST